MQQSSRLIAFLTCVVMFQFGHGQDMSIDLVNIHRRIEIKVIVYHSDSLVKELSITNSNFIIPEHIIIDADSVIISLRTIRGKEYSFQLVSKLMACRNVRYSFEDPRLRKRLAFWGDYCGEQNTIGRLNHNGGRLRAIPTRKPE